MLLTLLQVLGWLLVVAVVVVVVVLTSLFSFLYNNIKPVPPTETQSLKITDEYLHTPLFEIFPNLCRNVAWEKLGDYPTPLLGYRIKIYEDKPVQIWVKRESLASPLYGGNKVRTLEFLLASARATLDAKRREITKKGEECRVYAIGGGGSNQCVATTVFSSKLGIPSGNLYLAPEASHRDNSYNLLSVLNYNTNSSSDGSISASSNCEVDNQILWTSVKRLMVGGIPKFFSNNLFMPGGGKYSVKKLMFIAIGANPAGVLGHVGAVLELVNQVNASCGKIKEPTDIFLPIGSGCTTAGSVLGIAIARTLKIGFAGDISKFQLHGVPIHHALDKSFSSFLVRWIIKKLARDTWTVLKSKGGGVGVGVGDTVETNIKMVLGQLVIHKYYAVEYGKMTVAGQAAHQIFDEGK